MLTIASLSRKFKDLDTAKIIEDSLIQTAPQFEEANIAQLRAGKTNKGTKIKPGYRNKQYAAKKNQMNPEPGLGTPDLILTGSFTKQINMFPEGNRLRIFSNDEKAPDLEGKYKDIFGLGKEFKKDYINDHLRPAVMGNIKKELGI